MTRPMLTLAGALLLLACGTTSYYAEAAPPMAAPPMAAPVAYEPAPDPGVAVGYWGPHPVPPAYGGGFDWTEGPHAHPYAPTNPEFYALHEGYLVFVGDPYFYGYEGPMRWFYGPHVLRYPWGDVVCPIEGPHQHWEHDTVYVVQTDYVYVDGFWIYVGLWPLWWHHDHVVYLQHHWPHRYRDHYAPVVPRARRAAESAPPPRHRAGGVVDHQGKEPGSVAVPPASATGTRPDLPPAYDPRRTPRKGALGETGTAGVYTPGAKPDADAARRPGTRPGADTRLYDHDGRTQRRDESPEPPRGASDKTWPPAWNDGRGRDPRATSPAAAAPGRGSYPDASPGASGSYPGAGRSERSALPADAGSGAIPARGLDGTPTHGERGDRPLTGGRATRPTPVDPATGRTPGAGTWQRPAGSAGATTPTRTIDGGNRGPLAPRQVQQPGHKESPLPPRGTVDPRPDRARSLPSATLPARANPAKASSKGSQSDDQQWKKASKARAPSVRAPRNVQPPATSTGDPRRRR